MNNWNIDSWRTHQAKHIPVYPDQDKLKEIENIMEHISSQPKPPLEIKE